MAQIRYIESKDAIREELIGRAQQRRTMSYGELSSIVGVPLRGPWRPVLDVISREESAAGRPDITHLLINVRTGMTSRVEFEDARPRDPAHRARLREIQETCWAHHSPSSSCSSTPA